MRKGETLQDDEVSHEWGQADAQRDAPVDDVAEPVDDGGEGGELVEVGDIGRDLQALGELLLRLGHAILARAVAARAQVLGLHRLALAAAQVLQLIRDDAAVQRVDDERLDGCAVVLCRAALALPRLILHEEGDVTAQVEVCASNVSYEEVRT